MAKWMFDDTMFFPSVTLSSWNDHQYTCASILAPRNRVNQTPSMTMAQRIDFSIEVLGVKMIYFDLPSKVFG
jgi:hypothetical protein